MSDSRSLLVEEIRLREALRSKEVQRDFQLWCEVALAPRGLKPAAHHRLMIRELQAVADGATRNLMLFFPRGAGKSVYVKLFQAWWLSRLRGVRIIGSAHTQELAEKFSSEVQDHLREHAKVLGCSLASEARGLWRTSTSGEYRATGVGTKVVGFRADLAVIDDPVADAEAADSEPQRNALWDWYWGNLIGCLTPGAPVILVMTRWHEDDLAGRLLAHQARKWKVVSVPAIAEADDPLGRAPGEWLWDDDAYGYAEELRRLRHDLEMSGKMRVWWAQYQQQPFADTGGFFEPDKIRVLEPNEPLPPETPGSDVRAWDLAATAAGGDATVGLRLRRYKTGETVRFCIVDVRRIRGSPEQVERLIVDTAKGAPTRQGDGGSVTIKLPQDPGQAGKSQIQYLVSRLIGFRVMTERPTGSKETRAAAAASQVNVGNLTMARLPDGLTDVVKSELRAFPQGKHDDIVDALADAMSALVVPPRRTRFLRVNFMER